MAKAFYGEGRYWVKALSQAFGASKNKGTPEFSLRVLVMGKINPERPDGDLMRVEQNDRTIFLYITEKTAEYVIEDLVRIGYDKPSFRYLDPKTPGYFNFSGLEFEAFCEHESYEGETKEKWRIAKPKQDYVPVAIDDKAVRNLDTLFGKQLSKAAKKNEQKATPKQEVAVAAPASDKPAPPTEDSIPF